MRTLKCPASPCESVKSLSRYFMRIKMRLVEVSQTHVTADGCQHDHGSRWQLAEIGFRFSRHSQFFTGLVHVGNESHRKPDLPAFFLRPGPPPPKGECIATAGKLELKVGARLFQHFATFCIANKNHHHLIGFNGI